MAFSLDNLKIGWANIVSTLYSGSEKDVIADSANMFVFPISVKNGSVNVTNYGLKPNNAVPTDYVDFNKVFNGEQPVIAQWIDSLDIKTQVDNTTVPATILNMSSKTYKKGKALKGWYNVSEQGANFAGYPSSSDLGSFTELQSIRSFTLKFTDILSKKDLFNFYLIPSLVGKEPNKLTDEVQFLYISNIVHHRNAKGQFVYDEVTFSSVNDHLAKTGQQISGYIQMGAIGEGICFPQIIYNKQQEELDYQIKEILTRDIGVYALQIELLGNANICSVGAWGRPIEQQGRTNVNIYPSRKLMCQNWKLGISDPLSKKTDVTNVYTMRVFTPEISGYFNSARVAQSSFYTDSIKKEDYGYLESSYEFDGNTDNINPENKIINDPDWKITAFPMAHIGGKKDIQPTFDIRANPYFNVTKQDGTSYGYGTTINMSGKDPEPAFSLNSWDILNLNNLLFNNIVTVPMVATQSITWTLRDIPLIGSMLQKATFGFPIGWRSSDTTSDYPKFQGFAGFVNQSIYNFYCFSLWNNPNEAFASGKAKPDILAFEDNGGRVPLNSYSTDVDQVGGIIGSNSVVHSVTFTLTDKADLEVWQDDTGTNTQEMVTASTLYLGQVKDNKRYLWNPYKSKSRSSAVPTTITDIQGSGNYIIDEIEIQAIGKCPIRITAFSADPDQVDPYANIIFQTTIQSQGLFSGNPRDWLTVLKTSYLDDFISDNIKYTFPQQYDYPQPSGITNKPIWVPLKQYGWSFWENYMYPTGQQVGYTDKSIFDSESGVVLYNFANLGFNTWNEVVKVYDSLQFTYDYFVETQKGDSFKIDDTTYYYVETYNDSVDTTSFVLKLSSLDDDKPVPVFANFSNTFANSYPTPKYGVNEGYSNPNWGSLASMAIFRDGLKICLRRTVNLWARKQHHPQHGSVDWAYYDSSVLQSDLTLSDMFISLKENSI